MDEDSQPNVANVPVCDAGRGRMRRQHARAQVSKTRKQFSGDAQAMIVLDG